MEKNRNKAAMTVEAALVLPIFLFAMILMGYLGQMIRCQDEVQGALTRIAREASAEYGAFQSSGVKSQAYYIAKLSSYIPGSVGKVTFFESHFMEEEDEIDLVAVYQMPTPFAIMGLGNFRFRQRVHTRAFTGVDRRGKEEEPAEVVYITNTGRVYHRTRDCTYLKLSISKVLYGDLKFLRNDSGGKYKPCVRCSKGRILVEKDVVWITSYGDRYHTSASCSGLKRKIKEIRLSEVGSRPPCSKCGGKG